MPNEPTKHPDPADFWDLDGLIPPKPTRPFVPSRQSDTTAAEVTAPRTTVYAAGGLSPIVDIPLTERSVHPVPPPAPAVPSERYRPEAPLLFEVRLYRTAGTNTYYERFLETARRLREREGTECPIAEFYSYMPQYTQLTPAQLDTYLWWRTCFHRGNPLFVPYSYLLLYLYERINLGDTLDPHEEQEHMLSLWLSYRTAYPGLDNTVREWLCDYSLIHRLPPPTLPAARAAQLLVGAKLKEFYIRAEGEDALTAAMLQFCNNYDYHKSKFYRPGTAVLFDRVLSGAVGVALSQMGWKNGAPPVARDLSTQPRDAFVGALCTPAVKCRIEVDYISFSHTHDLRFIITDVLKYAENAIRAAIGVKPRLTVYQVSTELRAALDTYLAGALPPRRTVRHGKETQMPDYEKRYELPVSELSPQNAAAINEAAWVTTKRLVEAFDGETVLEITPPPDESPANEEGDLADILAPYRPFLAACDLPDRAAQRAFALSRGAMPDAIADAVNEAAAEQFGDIILEETENGYAILADYREELKEKGVL